MHLFKRTGNPQLCDNHRGISLLSIVGKVLERVLLNRLNEHLEQSGFLPEVQRGIRKDRETIHILHSNAVSREMPETEHGPLHDLVDLLKYLTQSVVRVFGKLWRCLAVQSSS